MAKTFFKARSEEKTLRIVAKTICKLRERVNLADSHNRSLLTSLNDAYYRYQKEAAGHGKYAHNRNSVL